MSEYVRRVKKPEHPIKPTLSQLDIELTERCNNDCIHCCINLPSDDADARAREMTTEEIRDILNQAAELGCLEVRLTGGEPLLRPDFEALYLYTRRLGMKVLLFTNACLITQRIADLFARIPPLSEIEVTVYGMHAESYEAVTRTPGSFEQFQSGVNLLLERRVPFVVKGALLPPNRHEIGEFEAWAKTIPWMSGMPGYSMFLDFRERRDDEEKNRRIESLRISPQEGLAVLARSEKDYKKAMNDFASRFMGHTGDTLFNCGAGHGTCIDAYGRAQPCMGVRSPEFSVPVAGKTDHSTGGAKRRSPLQAALDQFSGLQELRAMNPDYLRRCARCFLKGFCEQCPAKSWMEHGTLDTPVEYLCEVAHTQARYLGWVGEKEHGWEVKDWREGIKQSSIFNQ